MIASFILAIVSLMIATVLTNTAKQQSRIEDRAERSEFVQRTMLDLRLRPVATP